MSQDTYDSIIYQIYPEAGYVCIKGSPRTIPMRVNRAYLAAIEGHNWEPEGVEHTYRIIEVYSAHGRRTQLEPKNKRGAYIQRAQSQSDLD